jgi:segregation and condensation protein A
MNYKINLELFEGPLDLLLYLIRKNEINICDIPIAEVTDQYIQYIEMMKMMDLDGIGDFLVMAAELLRIKSRMLLPPDPQDPVEESDPRADLVRRLEEYQRIRQAAEQLRSFADRRGDLFPRRVDEQSMAGLKEDSREVFFEANLFDLVTALTRAILNKPEKGEYEVVREEYTVENKVFFIKHLLLERPRFFLQELFSSARDKMEVIVTFMAVLELCRQRTVLVVQKRTFSEIELLRAGEDVVVIPPGPPISPPGGLPAAS